MTETPQKLCFFLILMVSAFFASTCAAGPWLRKTGTGFLSATTETPLDGRSAPYSSIYVEYGAAPRLTLGFDGGADLATSAKAIIFARTSLWTGQTSRLSGDFGVGALQDATGQTTLVLRPGLSWAHTFTWNDRHGWIGTDATWTWRAKHNQHEPKIEITLGLAIANRAKFMLQATLENPHFGGSAASIAPNLIYRFRKDTYLATGLVFNNQSRAGTLKIGVWKEF